MTIINLKSWAGVVCFIFVLLLSQGVAAEILSGKWEVCDVLNISGSGCDDWWFNATGLFNFSAGRFVVFDVSYGEGFSWFNLSDNDVLLVDGVSNLTFFGEGNFTVYADGNVTLVADSNFTVFHKNVGVADLSDYLRVDDLEGLVDGIVDGKDFALAANVVKRNEISDYLKKNDFSGRWGSELSGSLVVNGSLWSAIDGMVPEEQDLTVVYILIGVCLLGLCVVGFLVGKVYLE